MVAVYREDVFNFIKAEMVVLQDGNVQYKTTETKTLKRWCYIMHVCLGLNLGEALRKIQPFFGRAEAIKEEEGQEEEDEQQKKKKKKGTKKNKGAGMQR